MCSAERAQEIVKRFLVGQIDHGKAQAPFIAIASKEIVVPYGKIKEIAWSDARRVLVVILGASCGNVDSCGASL